MINAVGSSFKTVTKENNGGVSSFVSSTVQKGVDGLFGAVDGVVQKTKDAFDYSKELFSATGELVADGIECGIENSFFSNVSKVYHRTCDGEGFFEAVNDVGKETYENYAAYMEEVGDYMSEYSLIGRILN